MRVNRLKYITAFISIAVASTSGVYAQNPTKADVESELARLSAMEVQAVACGRGDELVEESIGISVALLDARISIGMITGASEPIRVPPKAPAPCGSEADKTAHSDAAFLLWETLSITNSYLLYSSTLPWAKDSVSAPDGWIEQATELETQYRAAFAKGMPQEELVKQGDQFVQIAQIDLAVECARRKGTGCPEWTGASEQDLKLSEGRFKWMRLFPFSRRWMLTEGLLSDEETTSVGTPPYAFEGKSSDKRRQEQHSGSHNCSTLSRFFIFPLARAGARPTNMGRETLPLYNGYLKKVGTAVVEGVDTFRYKLISAQVDASAAGGHVRPKLEGGANFLLCLRTAN